MGRRPLCRVLFAASATLALAAPGCFGPAPKATPTARTAKPATNPDDDGPSTGLERLAADTSFDQSLPPAGPAPKPSTAELERRVAEQTRLIEELKASNTVKISDRAPGAAPRTPGRPAAGDPNAGLASLGHAQSTPAPLPSALPQASTPGQGPARTPSLAPPPSPGLLPGQLPTQPQVPAPTSAPIAAPSAGLLPAAPQAPAEPSKLAPPTAPADERLNAAADELARALRERATTSRTPAAEFAALAWLDTLRPGSLGSLDSGATAKILDPRQTKSITFTHDLALRISTEPTLLNDPDRLWRAISETAQPILQAKDVRITTADLCTKVDGFGQYDALASRTLLAGSPHTIVVYAEVDSYGHRRDAESGAERFTVELGQAVEVWQDADRPTLQKRWGETVIKDVSRRQRRDFYITSLVELPPNLSVGAYNLKIIVKDHIRTAQAEKTIPFTIVADGAVVASGNSLPR